MDAGEVASRYVVEPVAQRAMGALTGNPVDPTTGRKLIPDEIDFSLPGLMPFEWSRFYATDLSADSVLGRGWVLPWEQSLRREGSFIYLILQTLDNLFFYFGEVPDTDTDVPLQRIENALGHFLYFTRTPEGTLTDISATGEVVEVKVSELNDAFKAGKVSDTQLVLGIGKIQNFARENLMSNNLVVDAVTGRLL